MENKDRHIVQGVGMQNKTNTTELFTGRANTLPLKTSELYYLSMSKPIYVLSIILQRNIEPPCLAILRFTWKTLGSYSGWRPSVVTEAFRGFPQSGQNYGMLYI